MKFAHLLLASSIVVALPLSSYAAESVAALAATVSTPAEAGLTNGVVKKIDTEQGKLTISHEALPNLNMPSMTMVFRVADPAMTTKVKTGDRVKFRVEKANGALTVMHIESAT